MKVGDGTLYYVYENGIMKGVNFEVFKAKVYGVKGVYAIQISGDWILAYYVKDDLLWNESERGKIL